MLNRTLSYQYELLTSGMVHKAWLYNVKSCDIQWQSTSQLKSSAKITMTDDKTIDYVNDRIRIYATLNGTQFMLGTFLLCSSDVTRGTVDIRNCECYNLAQMLLDKKLSSKLQEVSGINLINEVIRLIGDLGTYSIAESTKTLNGEKTFEIDTSYLDVINYLLDAAGYTPLYTTSDGTFTAKPYVLPQDKTASITLKADTTSLVKPQRVEGLDIFNVPNVFTVYTDKIDVTPMSYTYTNDKADSVTSTVSRGRSICTSKRVEAASTDDLVAKAKQMCDEANSKFEHLELDMGFRTDLNFYDDCIHVKIDDIDSNYILYNALYRCKVGEKLKLKLRRVVDLFV